jgi:hydrogenase 3 maturation protease
MSKVLVLGVGNRLKGDDGVGCWVVDLLNSLPAPQGKGAMAIEAIDAGTVPENYLGLIVDRKPERVLIVDACLFEGKPGAFCLFDRARLENLMLPNFSTHTPPLSLIAQLIFETTGAEVYLLGIQPQRRNFGAGLSQALSAALPEIVSFIQEWASNG